MLASDHSEESDSDTGDSSSVEVAGGSEDESNAAAGAAVSTGSVECWVEQGISSTEGDAASAHASSGSESIKSKNGSFSKTPSSTVICS